MRSPNLILCGGATAGRGIRTGVGREVSLRIGEGPNDVHLKIEHLSRPAASRLADVSQDLLDIAAYVYAADQAVSRGGTKEFEYGQRWNRHFRFVIPVRRTDLWNAPATRQRLIATLGFLTDDEYEFVFVDSADPRPPAEYVYDGIAPADDGSFDEVMLFSGGLDSLAGAVQEVLVGRRRVALVSHRPENRVYARQCDLVDAIRRRCPPGSPRPVHVPVLLNKGEKLTEDFNQRSRSFVFAALAAVTADFLGLSRVRFYENGVTAVNLPMTPQLVGARASRTTHPRALLGFQRLFTNLFGRPFAVDNPFRWSTKAAVLRGIKGAGHADLCAKTCSCASTRNRKRHQPHCGGCSQCLDRRVAALAAGLTDAEDHATGYETDVLSAPRDGTERVLFESCARFARELDQLADVSDFLQRFPAATTELQQFGIPPEQAAEELFRLYKRHAADAIAGFTAATNSRLADLAAGRLSPTSLLGIVGVQTGGAPTLPSIAQAANGRVAGRPRADEGTLSFLFDGRRCRLGSTLEFHLIRFLCERFDREVSIEAIRDEVWKDDRTENNAVQRVASNLRRLMKRAGIRGLTIASQKGYYRLTHAEG